MISLRDLTKIILFNVYKNVLRSVSKKIFYNVVIKSCITPPCVFSIMLYYAGARNCASMKPPLPPPFVKYFTINHEGAYTQFVRLASVAYDAQLHEVTARLFSNLHLLVSFTECFHDTVYFSTMWKILYNVTGRLISVLQSK
jgi:hypothetical protein